ncbi:hypothetical protein [Neobacillus sp. D3-1R]|uniref:hypothetical protein n=1 Tax=Neobacillus sp. D3-1R TaxID=3445778 RepID=UPI003F9F0323
MRYITVEQLKNLPDSIRATKYLQTIWYQIEEGFIQTPLAFKQLTHIQHEAPEGWELNFDGLSFSLSKIIQNHGNLCIYIQTNGLITYKLF